MWAGIGAIVSRRRAGAARQKVAELISDRFRARGALLTDSGTSALRLAIAGAALSRPGAAAALPAFCCYDLATAADGAGVPVVLYDLDPATLGPRQESLARALAHPISSLVVAHLYGHPVDVPACQRLADGAGALLIEDAAQGIGGRLGGQDLGTFGSLSVLSLGRGKGWTGGAGGALVAHDDRGAAVVAWAGTTLGNGGRGWGDLARLTAQAALGRPGIYGIPASLPFLHLGETIYHRPHEPRGASDASVAAALENWSLLERETSVRRAAAERWGKSASEGGAGRRRRAIRAPAGSEPGYLRFPVMAVDEDRARFQAAGRLGVAPGYPRALCDLPGFGERVLNRDEDFDGARELAARLFTLPTHSRLSEGDLRELERYQGTSEPVLR